MIFKKTVFILLIFITQQLLANEKPVIRLGILAYGTVNWEITTLQHSKGLSTAAYTLKVTALASPQSGKIALQSGAVDMIVADWVWVSRLRSQGSDFSFYPYSNTSGALLVANDSPIKSLKDLVGKKLGIAGGELDKNWLLLQALAKKQHLDLNQTVQKVYAAPPLLNQQLLQGRIDALLNYWHFAARLETRGYRQLLNGQDILHRLGIQEKVPMLGYVFNRSWAENNKNAINSFLTDTANARNTLCTSDSAWQKILPLTKAKTANLQKLLRQRYCQGRIQQWSHKNQDAAEQVYRYLKQLSHNKLTGTSETIQPGTFWYFN